MLRRPASRARADHAHRRRMGFPGARAFRPKGRRSGVNNGNRSRKSPACRAAGAVLAGASRARGLAPLTEIDRFRIVLAIDVSFDGTIEQIPVRTPRSEEHTSDTQSLMRNPSAVFCLK